MKTLPMAPAAESQSCCEGTSAVAACCPAPGAAVTSAPWIIGSVKGETGPCLWRPPF